MGEAQVLFRVEEEVLRALDEMIAVKGFKTRNEWFRALVRKVLEEEERRKRVLASLDRLTVEGITEDDVVQMVKAWRARRRRG